MRSPLVTSFLSIAAALVVGSWSSGCDEGDGTPPNGDQALADQGVGDSGTGDSATGGNPDADVSSCGYVHDPSWSTGESGAMVGTTEAHNEWRYLVGLAPLQWNTALATSAQAWADHLAANEGCSLVHSSNTDRAGTGGFSSVGENLAGGSGGLDGVRSTTLWASERTLYDFGTEVTRDNFTAFGHYTQIVWSSTTHLGCGVASCGSRDVVACQYGPAGNFIGNAAYGFVANACVDLDNDDILQALDSDDTVRD